MECTGNYVQILCFSKERSALHASDPSHTLYGQNMSGKSSYEVAREQNIAKNASMLKKLGLEHSAPQVTTAVAGHCTTDMASSLSNEQVNDGEHSLKALDHEYRVPGGQAD